MFRTIGNVNPFVTLNDAYLAGLGNIMEASFCISG